MGSVTVEGHLLLATEGWHEHWCHSPAFPALKVILHGPVILTSQELAFSQTYSFAELFQSHPHKVFSLPTPSMPNCWDYFGPPTLCAHPFPCTPAFPGRWYYWSACNGGWKRGNVLGIECSLQRKMVSHLPFTQVTFEINTHTDTHLFGVEQKNSSLQMS